MTTLGTPPPAPTIAERIRRAYFTGNRWRSDAGAPLVSAEFVAELGRRGCILDVRTEAELCGPLELLGMQFVAALDGGMRDWRNNAEHWPPGLKLSL